MCDFSHCVCLQDGFGFVSNFLLVSVFFIIIICFRSLSADSSPMLVVFKRHVSHYLMD